ncbi:MAG: hypothetical protein VW582_13290, partial [Rhodospirillaceae bacterium]
MSSSKRLAEYTAAGLLSLALSACAVHPGGEDGWSESPDAVQTPYRNGVPHTDPQGRPRMAYDSRASFFPIGLYHAVTGTFGGISYSFDVATQAGHNTVVA